MCEAGLHEHVRVFGGSVEEFAQWLKQSQPRPTAAVVFTHFTAVKLLQVLWEMNLRVPDDLSITTFSNAYPVEDVIPPLTTVALRPNTWAGQLRRCCLSKSKPVGRRRRNAKC